MKQLDEIMQDEGVNHKKSSFYQIPVAHHQELPSTARSKKHLGHWSHARQPSTVLEELDVSTFITEPFDNINFSIILEREALFSFEIVHDC